MNSNKISIAICDEHPVIRYGLSQILGAELDMEVVLETSCTDLIQKDFAKHNPDILILDLEPRGDSGIECLRKLRDNFPDAKIIIYSTFGEGKRISRAIDLGVQGYLHKRSEPSDIIQSIRLVNSGGISLDPELVTKLHNRLPSGRGSIKSMLSRREMQVLELISDGKTNRDVSNALFISERTVKFHVSSILDKLQVRNRTEAALVAKQNNIHPTTHWNRRVSDATISAQAV